MVVYRVGRNVLAKWLIAVLLVSSIAGAGVLPATNPAAHAAAAGTTYYVDSKSGNDGNIGTDPDAPWASLAHVSASSAGFRPGDQILLKSGSEWHEPLDVNFSGADGSPIVVGKYGGDAKPVINGGGGGHAILIQNQQYVTVRDLEITNFNAENVEDYKTAYHRRSGVWVQAFHNGPMSSISLIGLDIHDVTGISITGETSVQDPDGNWVNKNSNAAIMVNAWEWEQNVPTEKHASFANLTIEDCNIHDIRTIGISVDGHPNQDTPELYHKNVVIRNNVISETGSDAIIVGVSDNPLIEYNAAYDVGINSVDGKWIAGIWVWKTFGATVQHNEVARVHYQNSASTDSNAFDVDILAQGVHVFQYNYTHDNAGGFTMDMGHNKDGLNIYRYNISQNDAHHGFSGATMNINDPSVYDNNVFYNDNGDGFIVKNNEKATFTNNIFYTSKGNSPFPAGPKFYNNDFFGSAPPVQGVNNMTVDPKFVDPGKGGDGIATADGYRLKSDSPLIGAGRVVDANGGEDFWGNALYQGSPDVGAFEDPNSTASDTTPPAAPTELTAADKTDTTVTLSWQATESNVPLDGEIFDAATSAKVASVQLGNTATLKGLTPDTSYSYYVVAKDASGNRSQPSAALQVKTSIAAVIVDDAQAAKTGGWAVATGSNAYGDGYATIAKGSGSNSAVWTPELAKDGYYSVYYYLPDGSGSRASNAPFTVNFNGGSKTYAVNERAAGGAWILLGTHPFSAGTGGNVVLTDQANGEAAADAVKFLYRDGFGPASIRSVALTADKLQLKIGETMNLSVMGRDAAGSSSLDVLAEGYPVAFHSDSDAVTVSDTGLITGVAAGTVKIKATVTINGASFESNAATVVVGPGFSVSEPAITDISGNPLTGFSPFGLVQASTTALNSTDKQKNVTLILAVYNRKGLIKTSLQSVVIPSYDHVTLTASLVMPAEVKGSYVKAFVWDGKDAMHPLVARTVQP